MSGPGRFQHVAVGQNYDGGADLHAGGGPRQPGPSGACPLDLEVVRLLADKVVELEFADSISPETVRQVLKKTNSSRG